MKWFDKTADGLSEDELAAVEEAFGFRFPPDMRELLAQAMPVGEGWPDWRQPHSGELIEWFDAPAELIEVLVEDGFWSSAWGERPEDEDDAVEEARRLVSLAPILIPVHDNLFLPARPLEAGNPLFALHDDGIAVAQSDLDGGASEPREIEFWSSLTRPE